MTRVLMFGAAAVMFMTACEQLPATIDEAATVDQYLVQGRYEAACVGLDSRDPEIAEYAAQRLADYGHVKAANECLCTALYNPQTHKVNYDVAGGVDGTRRDDLAECLSGALDDTVIPESERGPIVTKIAGIGAKASYESLAKLLREDDDPSVRAGAAGGLRASKTMTDALLDAVEQDADASVRAAAAAALDGHKGERWENVLAKAAVEDTEGAARAAALSTLVKRKRTGNDQLLCKAMMEDESATVRDAAVRSFHGSKRAVALDCLKARLMALEEDSTVRQSTMDAVKASPSDRAADILCEVVGPFARLHIVDKIQHEIPGTDIVKAQNDRDWERSLECAKRAYNMGGHSCFSKNYLAHWIRELGGTAHAPMCPGMEPG